jgi:hypothetical protein
MARVLCCEFAHSGRIFSRPCHLGLPAVEINVADRFVLTEIQA